MGGAIFDIVDQFTALVSLILVLEAYAVGKVEPGVTLSAKLDLVLVDLLQDVALCLGQDDLMAESHELDHVAVDFELRRHIDIPVG